MKKPFIVFALCVIAGISCASEVPDTDVKPPEVKKVCITVIDSKTHKEVEKCKKTKIHKKREGTVVPSK